MDSRLDWIEGIDQPATMVLASNHLSRMARRADEITEEVTKIRQRVDRMIQTFERTQGILSHGQNPDMEILENVEDLENVLHDLAQKKKYQQKLTVFIVGYEETCGQRRNLLTQLQEFFSIYSNMNEEGDQKQVESIMDLDGIGYQVTQAVKSAEAAMSRLADIHAGIMSSVNQTMSSRAQDKRKPSDDRGRKKIEKVLDQARQDIRQLTDELLQTQKDLTLKDQQMKELVTQNERRFLEIQHVKSQLEVTKKSLQTLQDETAVQQSLLEAELRKQEGQLKELEGREIAKLEHLTDAITQWEMLDSMSEDQVIPAINEEESNAEDFMETAEHTVPTDSISEHTEIQPSEMELQVTDTDKRATENEEPVCGLQVFDENALDTTLLDMVKEHNTVTVSVNVNDGNAVPTLYLSSEYNQPSETPEPIHDCNISSVEPDDISKLNDGIGSHIHAKEHEIACDVSQANTETSSMPYESEESLISNEDKYDHLNVPLATESTDESLVSQIVEEQITDILPLLAVPHVVESCQKPDESNHQLLSIALEEEHCSPFTVSEERQLSPPTDSSSNTQITVHLGTEKSTSLDPSLMPTEDTEFLTLIHTPNRDSFLIESSPETVEDAHLELSAKLEEGVQLLPPASNTAESLSSPLYLNNNFSMSSSSQDAYYRTSMPEPNNTALLTSFSEHSSLAESHSLQYESIPPVTSLALHSVNTKAEDNVHSESFATPPGTIHCTVTDPVEDLVGLAESSILSKDVEEIVIKKLQAVKTEQQNVANEKNLNGVNSSAEIGDFSQRLHSCVQEIRDMLMDKGFYSLDDGLTAEAKDCNKDEISMNLMQLKHLPAVLHTVLQSVSRNDEHKQRADEPAESVDITHKNMETQTDSHLLVRITEVSDQHSIGIPSRVPPDSNSSTHSLIFTRLEEEHNRRVLKRAIDKGKIPLHVYQDASRVMSEYRRMRQERLHSLASGYVQYISWMKAENHLERQCLTRPHITPALSKIKVLKHQVFTRWKEKREQSQQEKMNLSISLNQILQEVQEDHGIFLIKPVLSWPGRSIIKEGHLQMFSHHRASQRTRFPPLDQDVIMCSGKARPHMPKEWKTMYTDTELRPVVITPKLLEMDVHRYLCKECSVPQIRSSAAGIHLRTLQPQKLISTKISLFPAM